MTSCRDKLMFDCLEISDGTQLGQDVIMYSVCHACSFFISISYFLDADSLFREALIQVDFFLSCAFMSEDFYSRASLWDCSLFHFWSENKFCGQNT